jgi:hypothetical protein
MTYLEAGAEGTRQPRTSPPKSKSRKRSAGEGPAKNTGTSIWTTVPGHLNGPSTVMAP